MSTTQNVQRQVHLRTGDKFTAITKKNKLVDGTIESIDGASVKVKNTAGILETIRKTDITALQLDNFDYHILDYVGSKPAAFNPQPDSPNIYPGIAETVSIPSFPPADPKPITVKPYIPPEPDSTPWIWDRYNNPGYVEGSNGQQLQQDYVRSDSTTYALKFTFEAQETIEESTETVKVKRYTYRPA